VSSRRRRQLVDVVPWIVGGLMTSEPLRLDSGAFPSGKEAAMPASPSPSLSRSRALALGAFAAVAVFPLTVVVLNVVQLGDGYDARRQAISELALGRGGWLMALAFSALAAGTFLLAVLLRRTGGGVVAPLLLTLAAPLSLVSAVFRTDPTGAAMTTHGEVHQAAGIATFVLMLVAMAVSSVRLRREPRWHGLVIPTFVLTLTGLVGFFLVPALGDARFGLAQRVLVGSFVTWMLVAAAGSPKSAAVGPEASARQSVSA
jgi:hypothetical protein